MFVLRFWEFSFNGGNNVIVPNKLDPKQAEAVKEFGLGDVVASSTKAVGIKPCGSCQKRQAALNKATPGWVGKILGWFKR